MGWGRALFLPPKGEYPGGGGGVRLNAVSPPKRGERQAGRVRSVIVRPDASSGTSCLLPSGEEAGGERQTERVLLVFRVASLREVPRPKPEPC